MADPRFRSTQEPRDDDSRLRDRAGYDPRDFTYSSARDYEAAGVIGDRRTRANSYRDDGRSDYLGDDRDRASSYRPDGASEWDRDYGNRAQGRRIARDYDYDRSRDD